MYAAKWEEGGSISYLYAYNDLLLSKEANDTASDFVRERIRATLLVERLQSHAAGERRGRSRKAG